MTALSRPFVTFRMPTLFLCIPIPLFSPPPWLTFWYNAVCVALLFFVVCTRSLRGDKTKHDSPENNSSSTVSEQNCIRKTLTLVNVFLSLQRAVFSFLYTFYKESFLESNESSSHFLLIVDVESDPVWCTSVMPFAPSRSRSTAPRLTTAKFANITRTLKTL